MRVVVSFILAAAVGCGIGATAASGPSALGSRCVAGSVRWLERWDVAYAGRVLRPTELYRAPGGRPLLRLNVTDGYGFPTTLPIVAERLAANCRPTWFRVRVRSYPNGQLGWLKAGTMAESGSLMHPCETAFPIEKCSFVPWMPIGPPSRQDRSTSENAEMPSAREP